MVLLQPCDWIENDFNFKYVVDVFGRTQDDLVARVRLTGFQPYFYLKSYPTDSPTAIKDSIQNEFKNRQDKKGWNARRLHISITREDKIDAMQGFASLNSCKVWKLTFKTLSDFKVAKSILIPAGDIEDDRKFKDEKYPPLMIGNRVVNVEDVYEANLPPLLRLFHQLDISPASPIEFEATDEDPDDETMVDVCYTVNYADVKPAAASIPLYVAAYDIETYSESGNFPVAGNINDEIIQIGVSFRTTDDLLTSKKRAVFVSGPCSPSSDPTVKFISCKNEHDLLVRFKDCIIAENPDIIAGYNTFGFDDPYIAERAQKRGVELHFGRIESKQWGNDSKRRKVKTVSKTFELASGKFAVHYIDMPGRLAIDLLLSVRREQNLDSYKLDNVANTFLRDKVLKVVIITGEKTQQYEIHTKSTRGLFAGNLVRFDVVTNTSNPYRDGQKIYVKQVFPKKFIIEIPEHSYLFDDLNADEMKKLEWSFAKDDIHVKEMFASHHGKPEERAMVAKYCIQDCDLVLTLMAKLDTIVNARGMADVCRVPVQFIFLRGQGIKIYSAVVYYASKRNQIIMTQEGLEGDVSYEGAIVLPPKIGMYLDQPIPVLDFNSLYPSNMIAYNLSPDTLAYVKHYDGNAKLKNPEVVKSFAGFTIDEVSYDTYDDEKNPTGRVTCGFVQPTDDPRTIGILPLTLDILLKKRKETRKLIEKTEDDAQKSVLNGLQLAYKVVANSVYGQCGSKTSPIRRFEVAASTTAVGRQKIYDAKKIVEEQFGAEVIYGDTDSIFVKFPTKDLQESMDMARKAADIITASGRKAHKIEYEKTFYPFILFCRKRYVGTMYEDDVTKGKRKTMGVALKRRDNAPIVKDVFGGALDILMEQRDILKAQKFVQDMLVQVMQNKMPLEKYIITKQLRDDYKNPGQIAHRVLADRMEERDAGNAPQVGDRLAYIHVAGRESAKKQGEKIEQIDYVKEKGLKPDVEFYITNQIQNPVAQLFALVIEQLEGYRPSSKLNYKTMFEEFMEDALEKKLSDGEAQEEATLKVLGKKEKELDSILFLGAQYLKKHKIGPMDGYFRR